MSYRDILIQSVCTQKINFMKENVFTTFDVRITVHPHDACELFRSVNHCDLQDIFDPDTLEQNYKFCGCPLVQSVNVDIGTYMLEIIVAHQVIKTLKLTW